VFCDKSLALELLFSIFRLIFILFVDYYVGPFYIVVFNPQRFISLFILILES
jgi:hypothetical protein